MTPTTSHERHERLYRRWAEGAEGGLLITGNLMVDRRFTERSRNIVAGLAGESEWYETQIGRLGDGHDVKPNLHPVRAASSFIGGELVRGLAGRRRRGRLAAHP